MAVSRLIHSFSLRSTQLWLQACNLQPETRPFLVHRAPFSMMQQCPLDLTIQSGLGCNSSLKMRQLKLSEVQFDIHQPFTTVKEALQFSAWLRFGTDTSSETMEQFITEVMNLVELDSLEKALVGRPGQSGLSVEQRKRLTIAVELVANPSIVFMDEPTSGLPLLL